MRVHLRQLLMWLAKLLPKQQNSGDGAVQVGRAGGNVKVVNITQHFYTSRARSGAEHQADPPPIHVSRPDRRKGPRGSLSEEQHQILALMDRVPDRIAVLEFMEREFATSMVIALDQRQLYRLRRYVEVILAAQEGVKR